MSSAETSLDPLSDLTGSGQAEAGTPGAGRPASGPPSSGSSASGAGLDQLYLRLLDRMPVMLWTADAAGRWQHVNGRWVDYTGLSGETRGFGFEEALHPEDEAPTVARWRRAVERGENYEVEYRVRGRGGGYRWFLTQGVRVLDEQGQGVAWVGTCTDIEGQKRAEQQALDAREAALRALGLTLEARDRETQGHTDRVTVRAARLGQALGLDAEALDTLRLGAYLHDLGKLVVPDRVLLKPGPLTPQERSEMQVHAAEGERLVRALGFVPPGALSLVRHHHERWDGAGYPDRLAGEAIPLLARLFAVIDVYDALVSERPYKRAWTREQALAELREQAGRQFDPQVVEAFLGLPES
ncbi:HD domain-containing phosphohydrolase [Deinococcus budaensis]|uniref:PAS domain S-box-containing protein n=1 Tax=Deinococcus budaensis TaxID=1665626 RepID=A0A7W8GBV8_9DEIO|nr:HD domain-containing phosphohydrolase [Deinococcus budaensis]MBB5232712.1 PAS domain S-box-containing protein [Deinococcus budaensis]